MSRKKKRPSAVIIKFEAYRLQKSDPVYVPQTVAAMAAQRLAGQIAHGDFGAAREALAELLQAMDALPVGKGRRRPPAR